MDITDRQKKVLYCIVQEYINTKTPVSSKKVLENATLDRSSATVRNDMNRLMKFGYIYQPHTSAGRVPTDKGLRFYVNELLKIREEIKSKSSYVDNAAVFPIGDMEKVLAGAAKLLSSSTKGMVIIEKPSPLNLRINRIVVTPVSKNFSIANIVTTLGLSSSIPMQHREISNVENIEDMLNKMMKGLTLNEFKTRLKEIIMKTNSFKDFNLVDLENGFLEITERLSVESYEDYLTDGLANLLMNDRITLKKLHNILSYISGETFYKDLFELDNDIYIGKEHGLRFLDDFSVMIGNFYSESTMIGRVAMIFDKYSKYDHIIDSFDFMTNRLTEYFTVVSRNI
ncbi:MAG TPA: heat-inducible transcriptional repressor HrcA [Fervidobacterium sp.]|nr:heat-inducible transcriptional repressor HrcA [Fervidobacterium sp.]HPC79780.1 heat-inducible transcriptional repressor HrcA [Fervidobacterium sp.]HQI09348.1 heat-inducible transcriptional repressor HrcA [Fervidobacterium sp.]HQI93538.1 heat-inducible transcriptional repressor HrcA [Fervidobacterium sp.]HRT01138.1 heat-inducible transcriptional repressor HrcA [Fervidobacterium sp.]